MAATKPATTTATTAPTTAKMMTAEEADKFSTFSAFQSLLDPRLLRALAHQGFSHPTPIQQHAIPLALAGNDILARARTGSGKTLAYALPVLHRILGAKRALPPSDPGRRATRALFLVPTRELAEQVTATLTTLLQLSSDTRSSSNNNSSSGSAANGDDDVLVVNLARDASASVHRLLLADRPDAVVSTPSRALKFLSASSSSSSSTGSATLNLSSLESLVIDEADIILSYGHDADLRALLASPTLSRTFQSFLMSATMTKDVSILKGLVMRKPVVLNLPDNQPAREGGAAVANPLSQFYVYLSEVDKFLLLYVILKLRLIRGKAIIFVNDTERCYRVKLFLEQFGLRACALNRELPINSRYHIVQEFNKGVYDYIIATDEPQRQFEQSEEAADAEERKEGEEEVEDEDAEEEEEQPAKDDDAAGKKRKRSEKEDADQQSKKKTKASKEDADKDEDEVGTDENIWESGDDDDDEEEAEAEADTSKSTKKQKQKQKKKNKRNAKGNANGNSNEYGVSRGIDFINVACVINFDLPTSHTAYTHRIGRTARAGKTGTALSFVVPRASWEKAHDAENTGTDSHWRAVGSASARGDERVWKRILRRERRAAGGPDSVGPAGGGENAAAGPKEWSYDQSQVDGFRYRMEDALRSVTKGGIREARVKELKEEILNSEKLKAYFEDNPRDLAYLRHDKALHPTRVQPHLKHIPSYLMPKLARDSGAGGGSSSTTGRASGVLRDDKGRNLGFVGFSKDAKKSTRRGGGSGGGERGGGRGGRGGGRGGRGSGGPGTGGKKTKKADPLKKFK
ncbi:unnamed protein product [Tilletia controversa]|nr:hypothetical protein CF336_g4434 [Tilletia laevis]CAD6929170.1 unnamed protein product [Tilletia controversa]